MGTLKTVVVVCDNPPLGELLRETIAADPRVRVRAFPDMIALAFYSRIVDVDLLVTDLEGGFDDEMLDNAGVAGSVPVLGLSASPERGPRLAEVIVKPASPFYVRERALSLLGLLPRLRPVPDLPTHVIPLASTPPPQPTV